MLTTIGDIDCFGYHLNDIVIVLDEFLQVLFRGGLLVGEKWVVSSGLGLVDLVAELITFFHCLLTGSGDFDIAIAIRLVVDIGHVSLHSPNSANDFLSYRQIGFTALSL